MGYHKRPRLTTCHSAILSIGFALTIVRTDHYMVIVIGSSFRTPSITYPNISSDGRISSGEHLLPLLGFCCITFRFSAPGNARFASTFPPHTLSLTFLYFNRLASEYGLEIRYRAEFHEVFQQHCEDAEFKRLLSTMRVINENGESAMDEDQWEAASMFNKLLVNLSMY